MFIPNLNFENGIEKPLALTISVVGLIFGIFQVVLNIKVQAARNKAQLRYSEYKELLKMLHNISELLNEHMMKDLNIHGLLTSFMNRKNEYISFMNNNNSFLFPGIQKTKIAENTLDKLDEIHLATDRFRIELEKAEKKKALVGVTDTGEDDIDKAILQMNWHREIRENLKQYNDLKYKLLKEIQSYL